MGFLAYVQVFLFGTVPTLALWRHSLGQSWTVVAGARRALLSLSALLVPGYGLWGATAGRYSGGLCGAAVALYPIVQKRYPRGLPNWAVGAL